MREQITQATEDVFNTMSFASLDKLVKVLSDASSEDVDWFCASYGESLFMAWERRHGTLRLTALNDVVTKIRS